MKELLTGILALSAAIVISCLIFTFGTAYSLGYSIYMSVTGKDWTAFFRFWYRTIDGLLAAIGYGLYYAAEALDIGWNVNGEIIEDIITHDENTMFGQKGVTVSATIGKIEYEKKLNRTGRILSTLLNIAFMQKHHALDAYRWTVARNELKKGYFEKI